MQLFPRRAIFLHPVQDGGGLAFLPQEKKKLNSIFWGATLCGFFPFKAICSELYSLQVDSVCGETRRWFLKINFLFLYSWFPVTRTLSNSNLRLTLTERFSPSSHFLYNFTLDNSNPQQLEPFFISLEGSSCRESTVFASQLRICNLAKLVYYQRHMNISISVIKSYSYLTLSLWVRIFINQHRKRKIKKGRKTSKLNSFFLPDFMVFLAKKTSFFYHTFFYFINAHTQ